MKTKIENLAVKITPMPDLTGFSANPQDWLINQPTAGETAWLLAYADDGVIWGKVQNGKLIQAADVFGETFPRLESDTLQRVHFFGSQAEIRIWRAADGLTAVRMEDVKDPGAAAFSRMYLLWGNSPRKTQPGWSWVEDGQLGIHQALPLDFPKAAKGRPFKLQVRYYIEYEKNHGQARAAASRLVALVTKGGEE